MMPQIKATKQYTAEGWLFCMNEEAKQSMFKLHSVLPVQHFDKNHARIYNYLKRAVDDGVIAGFKMLNVGDGTELKKRYGEDLKISEDPRARIVNNPFTIYLHELFDPSMIADFCSQLELIYKDVPKCNRDHLSPADLELTDHITFRQETLDGEYVKIAGAPPEILAKLKRQGENSQAYTLLLKLIKAKEEKQTITNADYEKLKESHVQGFYDNRYNYYEAEFKSQDIVKQFRAACSLLQINAESLPLDKKEVWDKEINAGFRRVSPRYHSDKLKNISFPNTKERGEAIFKLVSSARDILKSIAKDPTILDKEKLLKQQEGLPDYQYELDHGFESDPYYYVRMALSSAYVVLKQNWDFITAPEGIAGDEKIPLSSSRVIQIYKPQLQVYRDQRKTIPLKGYEAFFRLFISGSLPRRFQQAHFDMALGIGIYSSRNKPFTPEKR